MKNAFKLRAQPVFALLLAAGAWNAVLATVAHAQILPSGSPRASATASARVTFLSATTPVPPTVIPRTRAKCSPGDCFSQFISIRANARWQLQVRLASVPVGYTVDLSTPGTPATPIIRLGTAWTAVSYVSGVPTSAITPELTFYGARVPGPNGRVPGANDINGIVQYQVVQAP